MSDKEFVLSREQQAWAQKSEVFGDWTVYQFPFPCNSCVGQGDTESEAWHDAANRIRTASTEAPKE